MRVPAQVLGRDAIRSDISVGGGARNDDFVGALALGDVRVHGDIEIPVYRLIHRCAARKHTRGPRGDAAKHLADHVDVTR